MITDALYTANAIPVSRGELLRLEFWTPLGGANYTFGVRWQQLTSDGKIVDSFQSLTIIAGSVRQPFTFHLTDGVLLAVTITAPGTGLQSGEVFATVGVQYGDVNSASNNLTLLAGYVTSYAPLNYPLSKTMAFNDGPGAWLNITTEDPGPGTNVTLNFPSLFFSNLFSFRCVFQTSAVAANRTINITLADVNGTFLVTVANAVVVASANIQIFLFRGTIPLVIPANTRYFAIPEIQPAQALILSTSVTNLDAGDDFTQISARYTAHVFTL